MKLIVNGRNIDLTDAIKEYVQQKIARLDNHYDFIQEVHVFLEVKKNPRIHFSQLAEATVMVNGAVVRFETGGETLYAAIDTLVDKIERGLSKHKQKLLQRTKSGHSHRGESIRKAAAEEPVALDPDAVVEQEDDIPFFLTDEDLYEEEIASARG